MNSWIITGKVRSHGVKNPKFPVLWIAMDITTKDGKSCTIFPNFDIQPTKVKQADYLKSKLVKDAQVMLVDASVVPIKMSKRAADGVSWETEEKPGIKCNLSGLKLLEGQIQHFNTGLLDGRVVKCTGNRMIVEQTYRIPNKNELRTRQVNVFIDDSIVHMFGNAIDKNIVLTGEVVGADGSLYIHTRQATLL